MRTIAMTYHHEDGSWWADSEDLPGFTAAAPTLSLLGEEIASGVAFELDDEPAKILLFDESGASLDTRAYARVDAWWSQLSAAGSGMAVSFGRGLQTSAARALATT